MLVSSPYFFIKFFILSIPNHRNKFHGFLFFKICPNNFQQIVFHNVQLILFWMKGISKQTDKNYKYFTLLKLFISFWLFIIEKRNNYTIFTLFLLTSSCKSLSFLIFEESRNRKNNQFSIFHSTNFPPLQIINIQTIIRNTMHIKYYSTKTIGILQNLSPKIKGKSR